MFSTTGRARALTDAQVRRILEWQRNRKTLVQVARENGVSRRTVYAVIRTGGQDERRSPPPTLLHEPIGARQTAGYPSQGHCGR